MYKILAFMLMIISSAVLAQVRPSDPWMPLTGGSGYIAYGDTESMSVRNNKVTMLVQYFPMSDNPNKEIYFSKLSIPVKTCTDKQGTGEMYTLSGKFVRDIDYVVGGISAGDGTITNACFFYEQSIELENLLKNK